MKQRKLPTRRGGKKIVMTQRKLVKFLNDENRNENATTKSFF